MRFLILSANTGGGHNAAAAAVQEELSRRGIESDIKDSLSFISELTSDFISWGHSYLYKHLPRVFGHAYHLEEQHSSQLIYESLALGVVKYHEYVVTHDYQAVICVHVFSSALVTEEQRRFGKTLPHYFIPTDYTCHPGAGEIEADAWLIPDAELTDEFVLNGVPRERIVATGIPIRREFSAEYRKSEMRRKLALPTDGRIVLLCCGSIGCGRMNRFVPEFEQALPSDVTLVVVCGNNAKLYENLLETTSHRTVVVGFTDKMADYMMAADICISKPGGLSTTELLAVGVPSILVLVVPGCESRNLEFVTARELAVGTENWEDAAARTVELLKQPEKLARLRQRVAEYPAGNGARLVADYIENDLHNK
ncbi:MAG: glycosyltransferase [Clostridia bacterium]|nr:glycosyltransferase [Clostridia bacterium]